MIRLYRLLLLLLLALASGISCNGTSNTGGSNILALFPHFGYSHFKVFYPLLQGLAERGHKLTVVAYVKNPTPHPNYSELLLEGQNTVNIFRLEDFSPVRSLSVMLNEYFLLHAEGQASCKRFYESGYVEEILKRHKRQPYDLVITEFFNSDCYLGLPHLLKTPVVGLSSCALMPWYYDRIRLPELPSYVQSEFVGFAEELNWHERLLNFVQARANSLLYRYNTNYQDSKLIKKYLNIDLDVAAYAEKATSLIFVNQHYSLSGNKPLTSQVIDMGGIHIDERQINDKLPPAISNFLNNVPKSSKILFISWGSMLRGSSVEPIKLQAILRVLERLKLYVIWKWEDEQLPTKSKNFLFVKWVPQLTLLCNPRVNLFWGHAGLLGTTEAVYCGKPIILTPVYGDQFTNANAVVNRKTGSIMHYNDIDETKFESSMRKVLQKSYADNAQSLSRVFRNRQNTPLNTTIWWVEHLLEHGEIASELLHTKAVKLNWFVYNSLDSVAILLAATLILGWILTRCVCFVCGATSKKTATAKTKKVKTN